MTVWNAISVPKATPQPIVQQLVAVLDASLSAPAVKKRFEDLAVPVPATEMRGPDALQKLVDAEVGRWATVFKGAEKP